MNIILPELAKTKKCLYLPLSKKWFDVTDSGIKNEDYRDITEYWTSRLLNNYSIDLYIDVKFSSLGFLQSHIINFKHFDYNFMTLAYPNHLEYDKIIIFEHAGISIDFGNIDLGANPINPQFIIKHGNRVF